MLKNAYYSILFYSLVSTRIRTCDLLCQLTWRYFFNLHQTLKLVCLFSTNLICDVVAVRIEWGYLVGLIPDFLVRTFF